MPEIRPGYSRARPLAPASRFPRALEPHVPHFRLRVIGPHGALGSVVLQLEWAISSKRAEPRKLTSSAIGSYVCILGLELVVLLGNLVKILGLEPC